MGRFIPKVMGLYVKRTKTENSTSNPAHLVWRDKGLHGDRGQHCYAEDRFTRG